MAEIAPRAEFIRGAMPEAGGVVEKPLGTWERLYAQGLGQALDRTGSPWRVRGEVHLVAVADGLHDQRPRAGVEGGGAGLQPQFGEQDMGRGQGGVTAQVDFDGRREPAKLEPIGDGTHEGRL